MHDGNGAIHGGACKILLLIRAIVKASECFRMLNETLLQGTADTSTQPGETQDGAVVGETCK